jgi:rod shape-determining protein MreC
VRDTRRSRLLLAIALVAALILIAVDYQDKSSSVIATARSVAGSVFGSAERAVADITRPVGRFFGAGVAGTGSAGRQAALERQLTRMRAELSAARLSQAQYRQLRRLLQLSGRGGYRVLAASVIAYGQGYQQTVTLDAGRTSGIKPQQTVIDGDGLVGQVVSVSATTSTVLLASDASSVVGVRVSPGSQIGWVTGQGSHASGGLLKLQVLDAAALKPGAPLVTSASVKDRPFVPGVPVGTIASIRSKAGALTGQALVRPYVNFGALDVVGVVVARPRHDPRFSVLPPKPRPTPSTPATAPPGRRGRSGHGASGPSASPSAAAPGPTVGRLARRTSR